MFHCPQVVAHMVMSIIAAVLASIQFCLGVSAAYFDHKHILEELVSFITMILIIINYYSYIFLNNY